MAKLTTAEFIEAIKELSVLELNELVKACEEEFGVSAAAGVVVAAAGAGEAAEEKTEFDGELTKLRLSKLFVKSQVLALKKLKKQLTALLRHLKKLLAKKKLKKSRLNLKLKALKLQLNNCTFQFDMEGISSEVPFVVCVSSKAEPHLLV